VVDGASPDAGGALASLCEGASTVISAVKAIGLALEGPS
jgi:hypothetical protein